MARILSGATFMTWGLACWTAAVSHQAFTWHTRCAGRFDRCLTDSEDPFNLCYLWLQNFALCLFVVARAYRAVRKYVVHAWFYAILNGAAHAASMRYGPLAFRQFEGTLAFSMPTWLILFVVNRICIHDWLFDVSWALMGMSFAFFKIVQAQPFLEWWSDHSIWFTDNDALHAGNMLFIPVAYMSAARVRDAPPGSVMKALSFKKPPSQKAD